MCDDKENEVSEQPSETDEKDEPIKVEPEKWNANHTLEYCLLVREAKKNIVSDRERGQLQVMLLQMASFGRASLSKTYLSEIMAEDNPPS